MNNLTTIEQGLVQELLAQGVENLIKDFMETSKGYGLPTDEIESTKLLIMVANRKLKHIELIDSLDVDKEVPF